MELIVIAGMLIYLFFLGSKVSSLSDEVNRLKSGVQLPPVNTEGAADIQHAQASQSFAPDGMQAAPNAPPQYIPMEDMEPRENAFIAWIQKDFFVKLGAFMLLLAFGWFVTYAFVNDWIGPAGQIALGLVSGVGIMVVGVWRIQKFSHQGAIFTVLGSSVVILTTLAGYEIYEFFTSVIVLGIMFLSMAFVALVSVQYRSELLALASLLIAGVIPFLTDALDFGDTLSTSPYLLVVVLGTLWVVYVTGSNTLTFSALLMVILYAIFSEFGQLEGLPYAFAFTAIFFIGNVVSILYKQDEKARQGHILTALLTGLYLIAWIAFAAPAEWQSLLYTVWMLVFSAGAFVVYLHTNDRMPFYIYSAVGIGLLAAATNAILDGPLLGIAYTIEVAGLVAIASALFKDKQIVSRVSLLFIGPVILSLGNIVSSAWYDGVIHADFAALMVLMFALLTVGLVLYNKRTESAEKDVDTAMVLCIGGVVYFLTLIWLVLHAALATDYVATMMSLVIYTVIGLSLYVRGQHEDSSAMKTAGGVLLGMVVLRLLIVDVWQMALAGKIITFFAVGILLISTAFIGKKTKEEHLEQE